MDDIVVFEKELIRVTAEVYNANPVMVSDLSKSLEWESKSISAKRRSMMAIYCQTIESLLQQNCVREVVAKYGLRLEFIVPSQDGFMVTVDEFDKCIGRDNLGDMLRFMKETGETNMQMSIEWEVKPFDDPLPNGIPKYVAPNNAENLSSKDEAVSFDNPNLTFAEKKTAFEASGFCKIIKIDMFVVMINGLACFKTKAQLLSSYEHLGFVAYCPKLKRENTKPFIKEWLKCADISRKDDIGVYPPDAICPSNVYNAYTYPPLDAVVKAGNFVHDADVVSFMTQHINILCRKDNYTLMFLLKWIGCCLQFPSQKLTVPVFISEEGAGKGSLMDLLKVLFGASKVLQTQEPSKDVWGEFNGLMTGAEIVILDEISKKEMSGSEGKIKGLITEPTIRINDKGKSRFEIASNHKFIAFSNPDAYGNEPMTTTASDRRKFFIQASDELIGNSDYFAKFRAYLANPNAMATMYKYFKELKDVKTVTTDKLPCGEYNAILREMALPILKQFEEYYFTTSNLIPVNRIVLSSQLYTDFLNWLVLHNIKYDCNFLQFCSRFRIQKSNKVTHVENCGAAHLKGWKFEV